MRFRSTAFTNVGRGCQKPLRPRYTLGLLCIGWVGVGGPILSFFPLGGYTKIMYNPTTPCPIFFKILLQHNQHY
jgi:hypothetical protein